MKLHGTALRLTVFIGEDDVWHHRPLFHEIVHRARQVGLAGATVLRGIEGYGAFLPQLDDLVEEGMVILDEVEVIRYVGRSG